MHSLGRRGTPGSGGPIGLSQEPSCLTLPPCTRHLEGLAAPSGMVGGRGWGGGGGGGVHRNILLNKMGSLMTFRTSK